MEQSRPPKIPIYEVRISPLRRIFGILSAQLLIALFLSGFWAEVLFGPNCFTIGSLLAAVLLFIWSIPMMKRFLFGWWIEVYNDRIIGKDGEIFYVAAFDEIESIQTLRGSESNSLAINLNDGRKILTPNCAGGSTLKRKLGEHFEMEFE